MGKRKIRFALLLSLMFIFVITLVSCSQGQTGTTTTAGSDASTTLVPSTTTEPTKEDITILYTNDIHGYIANTLKDSNNPGLRLDSISAYRKKLINEKKNVLLFDCGDEIQGSVYGALDKGVEMVGIMNKVGFDLATPGNHDYDFGMDGFNRIVSSASYKFISCNFRSLETNKTVLDSSKTFEIGGVKIGVVGITTPETLTSSTPAFFQNDKGEFIYTFDGVADRNDLYTSVQNAIDEIRNKVDYVIALGHLGVAADDEKLGTRSIDVINNTTGLDAFIDGHSHTLMEKEIVKTKDNKDCLLTQTGCYLDGFGEMTISKDGVFSAKIINSVDERDDSVTALEDALIAHVNRELGEKIAVLDKPLYITSPDNPNQRLVRARETNLGDFVADSIYWYINDYKALDCDIAFNNGGGIRANIDSGDVTYLSAKTVEPFGNQICVVKTKGINIKNALEMGLSVFEGWNTEWNCPAETGGFLQVAGIKFEADANVKSSVKTDDKGMFKSVDGDYRVKNIMVYNKQTSAYEPLDENKEYTVSGINYILRNSGNGLSMFNDSTVVLDYIAEDYMVLADYMKAFNGNVNNANAPLKKYANYLLDYETPSGSGRIELLNL